MKLNTTKIFGNIFDDIHITSTRLLNFADETLGALKADNENNQFSSTISMLQTAIDALRSDVSGVDISLSIQKGATLTAKGLIKNFKTTMSESEGIIAYFMGGRSTKEYISFYPNGIDEYSRTTKTKMGELSSRIQKATAANMAKLPPELVAKLSSFEADWQSIYLQQESKKGTVSAHRDSRNQNRHALNTALQKTIYKVADTYIGQIKKCDSFFNFSLLFSIPKHPHKNLQGDIASGEQVAVINRLLRSSAKLTLQNTCNTAEIACWFAYTPDEAMPEDAFIIKEGESKAIPTNKTGNKTCFMVKNLSPANKASYHTLLVAPRIKG